MNERLNQRPPDDLVALSRAFGGDSYVLGGGGNISWKDEALLWIKPSGVSLAGLRAEDPVPIDRAALRELYDLERPEDASEREALVMRILAGAVADGSGRRPSVETPLHDSLRAAYVLHTHPAVVNGLTCAAAGGEILRRLFPDALWMPRTDPGYTLAIAAREALVAHEAGRGRQPDLLFLQNHGLVVAGETAGAVRERMGEVVRTVEQYFEEEGAPLELAEGDPPPGDVAARRAEEIRRALAGTGTDGAERLAVVSCAPFEVAEGPLTPDHIVYHRAYPLAGEPTVHAVRTFREATGYAPVIFACPEGVYATGPTRESAGRALAMARDGGVIRQLTAAAGGICYMDEASRRFVETWEAEQYRKKVAEDGPQDRD
jgi:rhamnose utilization protein RhaD (predicted bifunctional aldolase and dehydrogenase)